MTDETYNGWKNYPTWNVNLWLSNEEGLYNEALRRVRWETDANENGEQVTPAQRHAIAEVLKTWVRDELAPDLGATFAADLLGYALDDVDWDEIAAAWIESVNEQ